MWPATYMKGVHVPDRRLYVNCAAIPETLIESELFGYVINIFIPPLRHRLENLFDLIPYLVGKACHAHNESLLEIPPDIFQLFALYDWPGNIRELENCIENN